MIGRSWVEIDILRLLNNYFAYRECLNTAQHIMAVVKADAYGHGSEKIASVLQSVGVTDFAVSNLEEAIQLRNFGITGQILILGYTPIERISDVIKFNITQTIISEEYADELIKYGKKLRVHIAINTGMNRIGIDGADVVDFIKKCVSKFHVMGLFTHLCVADSEEEVMFTKMQIEKFNTIVSQCYTLDIPYIHYSNSAGGICYNYFGNIVRLGISLFGLESGQNTKVIKKILPVLTWKTVVSMIRFIKKGETVGYARSYVAQRDSKIAVLPTGYADGYSRALSNKGHVVIHGRSAPIVGKICMDQMMVDVTDIENIHQGDEVVLIGDAYTADDMATDIDTIGYEIICSISKRVPRVYCAGEFI